MDLFNEVRIDFSGVRQLAGEMERAQRAAAGVRQNLTAAGVTGGGVPGRGTPKQAPAGGGFGATGGQMPGFALGRQPPAIPWVRIHAPIPLPVRIVGTMGAAAGAGRRATGGTGDREDQYNGFKLAATGAAASAFAFKAVSLASPSTMAQFELAIKDTTAVIGRELIPVFVKLTALIREFGNFLARNPAAAKGIAYGSLALGAGGLAMGGVALARGAIGTASWAARGIGGLFGGGGAASTTMAGTSGISTGADIAEGAATRGGAARGAGLLGRAGRFAGRASPYVALAMTGLEFQSKDTAGGAFDTASNAPFMGYGPSQWVKWATGRSVGERMDAGTGGNSFLDRSYRFARDTSPYAAINKVTGGWLNRNLNPFPTSDDASAKAAAGGKQPDSYGAAAQPTTYTDALSAVMSLRQGFTSLGKYDEKGDEIQSLGDAAGQLKEAADALKEASGRNTGRTPRGG
jgi:hypothetical protein